MFNNVVSYYTNEHSGSKRNFGLQSDLGQRLKETVNYYHNYNLQIKIRNEAPKHKKPYAPQLNVSSSSSEGDNSKYYENFINNLVETNKPSSAQIAKRKKSKTYKLNKNDLEIIKQKVNTINHKSKGESSCASSGNSGNKRRSSKKKKTNISNNNNNSSNRKSTFLKGRLTFTDDVMAFNQKFNEVKSINIKRKGADILKKVLAEVNKENNENKNVNKSNNNNCNPSYNKPNQCSNAQTLLKHTNTEGDINKRNKHFSEDTVQTLVLNKNLQNYNYDSKGIGLNYGSERRNFTNDKSNKSQFSNNTNRNLIGNSQLFPTQNFLEIKKEESFCIRKKKTNEIIQHKQSLTSNNGVNNDCESKTNNNNDNNNENDNNNCEEGNITIKKELPIENNNNIEHNNIRPSLFYHMKKITKTFSNNDKDDNSNINNEEGNVHIKENINENYFQKEIIENKHCSEDSNNINNNDSNNKRTQRDKKNILVVNVSENDITKGEKEKKKKKYFCCFNI